MAGFGQDRKSKRLGNTFFANKDGVRNMLRGILIGALSVAIIGTGYWGYQEHKEKNTILIHAENNYQRAFHDLAYQVDLLHDKIGTTLAMNSRSSLSPALAEVWRITSEAHSSVGQLPLSLLPFNKTEEFLSKIGDFSYRTAVRNLDKEPLTDEEYQTLQSLYNKSNSIQKELRNVQHLVIKNNLRWMDVELALAQDENQLDNTIIDGFKTVEKDVEAYSEAEFGPAFTGVQKREQEFQRVDGKEISKQQAINLAKHFLQLTGGEEIKITESGGGSDIGFYSLNIVDPKTKAQTNMDITKKGGYPIWVIQNRTVKDQNISLNKAANISKDFLTRNGFNNQEIVESAQYDHIGVFTFAPNLNGVRIYPEAIKIKVALDNGKIIGFSAREYLSSAKTHHLSQPSLTMEEARKKINLNVKIMEEQMALIVNDIGEEVLCYEFLGTLNNDTYQIFINANTGEEEKVLKLKNAEPIYNRL